MLKKRRIYKRCKLPVNPGKDVIDREIKKVFRFPRNYRESLRILNRFCKLHGYENIIDFAENYLAINVTTFYKNHKNRNLNPLMVEDISEALHIPIRLFMCRKFYGRYWKWARPLRKRRIRKGRKMKRYYNVEHINRKPSSRFNAHTVVDDLSLEEDRKVSDVNWLDQK